MTRNMYPWWQRTAMAVAVGIATLAAAPAALAGTGVTLDFDTVAPGFLYNGTQFEHQGVLLSSYSNDPEGLPEDTVGAIFDGNDASTCMGLSCPTNNFTPGYYAGLNDGVLVIDAPRAGGLQVKSFDASFIGAFPGSGAEFPGVAGVLEMRGYGADGQYQVERFNLGGPLGNEFFMQRYDTSASFANTSFAEIVLFAYRCDYSGTCSAFETNGGQFALDNVALTVTAVPEPSAWLTLFGGLGLLGATLRRRRLAFRATSTNVAA
ncbi:MAG: NF038120 family PEP-CTERM protein [Duganella sp.]